MLSLTTRHAIGRAVPVLAALVAAAPATAAPPAPSFRDSVSAHGTGRVFTSIDVDVTAGPSGENPTGHANVSAFGVDFVSTSITCLSVNGHTATLAGTLAPNFFGLTYFKATDYDNGPAGSNLDAGAAAGFTSPPSCATPTSDNYDSAIAGDIAIVDSPVPPTSRSQCAGDAYRRYGFTSLGLCTAYVELHGGGGPA